jgi:hypothetical protein
MLYLEWKSKNIQEYRGPTNNLNTNLSFIKNWFQQYSYTNEMLCETPVKWFVWAVVSQSLTYVLLDLVNYSIGRAMFNVISILLNDD